MTEAGSDSPATAFSPERRTAVLFVGAGTAGAYHAGVARALRESGLRIDLAAGQGAGALTALCLALDSADRVWTVDSPWSTPTIARLYGWRRSLKVTGWAFGLSLALVAAPLLAMVLGLVVYPLAFLAGMVGLHGERLVTAYLAGATRAFAPDALPTWLPRLVLLVLAAATVALGVAALVERRPRPTAQGRWWWRLVPAPIDGALAIRAAWRLLWHVVRGADAARVPSAATISARVAALWSENRQMLGFCAWCAVAHDLDAGRDLVASLDEEPDAAGAHVGGESVVDVVAASLSPAGLVAPHAVSFGPSSAWPGETHRLCDRPETVATLFRAVVARGMEQVLLVTPAASANGPHQLTAPPLDPRDQWSERTRAAESAVVAGLLESRVAGGPSVFVIRPAHNPVGPFAVAGANDARSRRWCAVEDLVTLGYDNAWRQFLHPMHAAPAHTRDDQW